jgi:purine-cytosine permease-like protein
MIEQISFYLLSAIFGAVVMWFCAKTKNRNPVGWAIAGSLSWIIALIFLACLPYLCPKCRQKISYREKKADTCPHCTAGLLV